MITNPIRHLEGKDIDRRSWNLCIRNASNGLIYGYSMYLDSMAENWDALVFGDYSAVMPLPWRKKWGIHYIYQPFLTAQLGVFGNDIDEQLFSAFLKAIPAKFRLWEFSLNHRNIFSIPGFDIFHRTNFVLALDRSYESLYKGYRENIRRNIKKSEQYGCRVATGISVDQITGLVKMQGAVDANGLKCFENLCQKLAAEGKVKTYGVRSADGKLLASAVFLFSHHRAYYILVGNHPNGRTLGASHALIDGFIKDHAGQNLLLDFEGSDLRNLAFFYSSFGASEETYAAIRYDRLPWYVRLFKKSSGR